MIERTGAVIMRTRRDRRNKSVTMAELEAARVTTAEMIVTHAADAAVTARLGRILQRLDDEIDALRANAATVDRAREILAAAQDTRGD